MKTFPLFSSILLITALLFATPAFAQKRHKVIKTKNKRTHVVHNKKTNATRVVTHKTNPNTVNKTRVVHNPKTNNTRVVKTAKVVRPVVGARVNVLPVGYKRIAVGNAHYYHHLGSYYKWHPTWRTYVVVRPPLGAVINTMPTGYTVVNYNGLSHYALNGVYYRPTFRNGVRVYVVARV